MSLKKICFGFGAAMIVGQCLAQPINRQTLVQRHKVVVTSFDTLASLSVGNGSFAYTVDATGMQSFPEAYANGVPLGTQSDWGWHSFPNLEGLKIENAQKKYHLNGRDISYTVQIKDDPIAVKTVDYFRVNPHRLQLGNIGLEIIKKDGSVASMNDIKNVHQELNPWTGIVLSTFTVEGVPVQVNTSSHPSKDILGFNIHSTLLKEGRIKIRFRFPYPNGQFKDQGVNWKSAEKHRTDLTVKGKTASIIRTLDTSVYNVQLAWVSDASIETRAAHDFIMMPFKMKDDFSFTAAFHYGLKSEMGVHPDVVFANSISSWKTFWMSGGAVDFSGSTDPRAFELERRIVLSQYLTKIQCTSPNPPQETGLTYNSWFGKPHIEMHWWHAVHFAQWGRTALMEKSLDWYFRNAPKAFAIARRQGFAGLRWQKMTDNNGDEAPSSVAAFLIWQQPHFIYMADLLYRKDYAQKVIDKYADLVFATADFMADFAHYNSSTGKYDLGKGLIPAQECFDAQTTFNPTYELAYWWYALNVAQNWRVKKGLKRNDKWDDVLNKLAPYAIKDGLYLPTESTPDGYTNPRYMTDHPAVLSAYGVMPLVHGMDTAIMKKTYLHIKDVWNWGTTWGWDYPMMSMTATRLHMPNEAINALMMPQRTNTYLPNGHNYQDGRLTIYLPGNGGLLSAVALMCTGSTQDPQKNIGFPKDGTWKVRWEGLRQID